MLGGALSIQTKNGRDYAGSTSGRRPTAVITVASSNSSTGVDDKGLDLSGDHERLPRVGLRDASPSKVQQFFGKLGWANADTDIYLTYAFNNRLIGNGLAPVEFLRRDYSSIFTKPYVTRNISHFVNLAASHEINDRLPFSGNTYYRRIKTGTPNGDANDDFDINNPGLGGCDDSEFNCSGLLDPDGSVAAQLWVSGQFTLANEVFGQRNQFIVGAAYDESRIRFGQTSEFGELNPLAGVGFRRLQRRGRRRPEGDHPHLQPVRDRTSSTKEQWHLTVSGRYNDVKVANRDQVVPTPGDDHSVATLSPASTPPSAWSWTPSPGDRPRPRLQRGQPGAEHHRTSVRRRREQPLSPAELAGRHPPLRKVVTRTVEAGLRGLERVALERRRVQRDQRRLHHLHRLRDRRARFLPEQRHASPWRRARTPGT
jgi:outer membrane receptor protein involved in Fe transport